MPDTQASNERGLSIRMKLLLGAGGVAAAFGLATAALTLFPGLIPDRLRPTGYQRQYASVTLEVEYRTSDGDLFAWLPGKVRPPAQDEVLARYTLAWDTDGFRKPAREAEHYPIAAFGDSFTEAADVARPWPDKLAEELGAPVRNYGFRGYGPREIAQAARKYAGQEPRTWVIYAHFAGNDLYEANRSDLLEVKSPFDLWPFLARGTNPSPTPTPASDHYDFPLPVIIGGNYYEMAFLPYYMWWQFAPPEGFEASRTFQTIAQAMDAFEQATESCRALVFIPVKEHLYYRYIYPTDHQWIRKVGQTTTIDENGQLQLRDRPYGDEEEDYLLAHLTDQRDAVARLVTSRPGWRFIDLLPAFLDAAGEGELLYYPYDTHWNQAGHDLAAKVIAGALRDVPDCPVQ